MWLFVLTQTTVSDPHEAFAAASVMPPGAGAPAVGAGAGSAAGAGAGAGAGSCCAPDLGERRGDGLDGA